MIEQGSLLLGNIEFQIEQHLPTHGTRIDTETRWFLARVRDAAGSVANDARGAAARHGRAEHSSTAAPHASADQIQGTAAANADCGNYSPGAPGESGGAPSPETPHAPTGAAHFKGLVHLGVGAACGALVAILALEPGSPVSGGTTPHEPGQVIADAAARLAPTATVSASAGPERGPMDIAGTEQPPALTARIMSLPGGGYPGPRDRSGDAFPADPIAPMRLALAEASLDLSDRARAEVQQRLALAGFYPKAVDGVFGPATRAAILEWQVASGLRETGHLDEAALAALLESTEDEYHAWQVAERKRDEERAVRTAVLESPVPPRSPEAGKRCERHPTGEIVYGQGVRCDFRGLKENIAQLFRRPPRSGDMAAARDNRNASGA